ncbi:SDR family NAD(P)-dependent oxidoreductase [Bradyrhizobium genosp. P]|uniref:SDR family NAD(P)-dependent oxidoreductase n=1 Tax=Bradyrhizobium genosp. P TaxID=83641 RepID=UPI003CF5F689
MSARKDKGLAVVTGASQGIGAVYARKLAERGHDVVLVARNRDRLRENAAEIRAATSREAEVVVADLSTAADTSALAERLRSDPAISVLINNAGATLDGGLLANDADAVARQIALNVTAPTLLAQAAAKAFIARGGGAIVNISSVAAFAPEMFDGAYSGSKMYLLNLTLGLASKAKDSGVRFQAVLPGPTNTDMWARGSVPASVVPPERIMEPEDLVEAALMGLDRGEVVTAPTIDDEAAWQAYEAARRALGSHFAAGKPAARYRASAPAL